MFGQRDKGSEFKQCLYDSGIKLTNALTSMYLTLFKPFSILQPQRSF